MAMRERRHLDLKPLEQGKVLEADNRIPNEEGGDSDCLKQLPTESCDKDSFPEGSISNASWGFEEEAPNLEEEIVPEKRND